MVTWADNLMQFYTTLQPPSLTLPNDIEWLYPQQHGAVLNVLEQFLYKYYHDAEPRHLLLGINPGRLGAGVTGVNFTAPRQLTAYCHIEHSFKDQSELSAEFIYSMIQQYGGVEDFYKQFYISSVCPLGFVQGGKNINYYDDKALLAIVEPFIKEKLSALLAFNVDCTYCYCMGGDKNFRFLNHLNATNHWFKEIIPLPHPRFIMQYKRKEKNQYINEYLLALSKARRAY